MKRTPIIAVTFALLLAGAYRAKARIGDDLQTCISRYGEPVARKADGKVCFSKSGFGIVVTFFNGYADSIYFGKLEKDALGNSAAISDNEIALLLKANGGGREWQKADTISADENWITADHSLVALHTAFDHHLFIMTKEAAARASEVQKREEQKKLDGF